VEDSMTDAEFAWLERILQPETTHEEYAKVERTLQHALEHVRGELVLCRRKATWANENACTILRTAIDNVRERQAHDEAFLQYLKDYFPDAFVGPGPVSARQLIKLMNEGRG